MFLKFQFSHEEDKANTSVRGLGTDVALVSSMVFLAQFILSLCMGSLVHLAGSTVTIVIAASVLSFCGAVCATQVTYLDLWSIHSWTGRWKSYSVFWKKEHVPNPSLRGHSAEVPKFHISRYRLTYISFCQNDSLYTMVAKYYK